MPFDATQPLPVLRRLKLDFAEPPKPVHVTAEGFRDYEGIASLYDTVLDYPLEAPARKQFRPASALDDAALASGAHKPIVNSHPRKNNERVWVLPDNASQFVRGTVIDLRRDESDATKLRIKFRVFDAALMADIDAGKVDLSPGYDCKTVVRAGTSPSGEHYDAVQEGPITFNHFAVEYRGRNPGARITADGQDDISMDEIIALINGGTLKPEDLQKIEAAAKSAIVAQGGPAAQPAGTQGNADIKALEGRLAQLESKLAKSDSADAPKVDEKAITERVTSAVTTAAARNLQSLSAARQLATPILGSPKVDGMDDVNAIHRDVVIQVLPEQKTLAEAHYAAGEHVALASLAQTARALHNKKITADSADELELIRGRTPEDRKNAEVKLGEMLEVKK